MMKEHTTQIFVVDFLDQLRAFRNSWLLQTGLIWPKPGREEGAKKKKTHVEHKGHLSHMYHMGNI